MPSTATLLSEGLAPNEPWPFLLASHVPLLLISGCVDESFVQSLDGEARKWFRELT